MLSLDLSFSATGWAHGNDLASAQVGVWNLPGASDSNIDRSLGSIYSAVNMVCRENKIDGVIIEAALRTLNKKNSRDVWTPTSAHGDRVLTMLNGAARAGAANAGVRLFKFPAPNTWRAEVLGNGYPKDAKGEAVKYCGRMGRDIPNHNSAEAFCMLVWGLSGQNLLDRIKG